MLAKKMSEFFVLVYLFIFYDVTHYNVMICKNKL